MKVFDWIDRSLDKAYEGMLTVFDWLLSIGLIIAAGSAVKASWLLVSGDIQDTFEGNGMKVGAWVMLHIVVLCTVTAAKFSFATWLKGHRRETLTFHINEDGVIRLIRQTEEQSNETQTKKESYK